jgi:hypothetical protein
MNKNKYYRSQQNPLNDSPEMKRSDPSSRRSQLSLLRNNSSLGPLKAASAQRRSNRNLLIFDNLLTDAVKPCTKVLATYVPATTTVRSA